MSLSAALLVCPSGVALAGDLTVNVTNIEMVQGAMRGTVYVCLYPASVRTNPGFPSCEIDGVRKIKLETATAGKARTKFAGLANGKYALSAFQDTDGDGRLTMGVLLPKERVGTYKRSFGRPTFDDISFDISSNSEVTIDLVGF
jgi:uncharacterized protein (DUF2141 family)